MWIPRRTCFVDSSNRSAGTTSFFSFAMTGTPLKPDPDPNMDTYVAIRTAVIPLTYNSVNTTNNVMSVSETQGTTKTFTVTIPAGQYDLLSMQTTTAQALSQASTAHGFGLPYNVTISTTTGSATFSLTSYSTPTVITFNFGSVFTAASILGLPSSGAGVFTQSTSYTGTGIVSISGPRYICIRSPNFIQDNYEVAVNGPSNILESFPITAQQYSTQIFNPSMPITLSRISATVDSPTFDITDENGINLDLRGQPVQFLIALYVLPKNAF